MTLARSAAFLVSFTFLAICSESVRGEGRDAQSGSHAHSIVLNGFTRTYTVHVPAAYKSPPPLVIMLHGGGGTARAASWETGWTAKAEREGFLVVFPNALARDPARPSSFAGNPQLWNDGSDRFYPDQRAPDDVGFIAAVLDELSARFAIDARRIYVTGFSNGGSMSFRVGAELSERIAAIAPVAGALWFDPPRFRVPVSMLYITGTADPLNLIEGGVPKLASGGSDRVRAKAKPPVRDSIRKWAGALGCPEIMANATDAPGMRTETYAPCANGAAVVYVAVDGLGHTWAGAEARCRNRWWARRRAGSTPPTSSGSSFACTNDSRPTRLPPGEAADAGFIACPEAERVFALFTEARARRRENHERELVREMSEDYQGWLRRNPGRRALRPCGETDGCSIRSAALRRLQGPGQKPDPRNRVEDVGIGGREAQRLVELLCGEHRRQRVQADSRVPGRTGLVANRSASSSSNSWKHRSPSRLAACSRNSRRTSVSSSGRIASRMSSSWCHRRRREPGERRQAELRLHGDHCLHRQWPCVRSRRLHGHRRSREELVMARLEAHYSARDIETRLLTALRAAGLNPGQRLSPEELGRSTISTPADCALARVAGTGADSRRGPRSRHRRRAGRAGADARLRARLPRRLHRTVAGLLRRRGAAEPADRPRRQNPGAHGERPRHALSRRDVRCRLDAERRHEHRGQEGAIRGDPPGAQAGDATPSRKWPREARRRPTSRCRGRPTLPTVSWSPPARHARHWARSASSRKISRTPATRT